MFSEQLLNRLANAESVAILTGAGVSAESGVPTFRDPGGLWEQFRPEELANFDAFMRNPVLVSSWYAYRREIIRSVEPNPGHYAIAEMETLFDDFTLITQNVDNLHRRAGSVHVVELHGNIMRNYCLDCRREYTDMPEHDKDTAPRCTECGGLIRPDVVWFGELLPQDAVREAEQATRRADVFFSIGTSAIVYPAAGLPHTAREHGAYVVEINPSDTDFTPYAQEVIKGPSGTVMPRLVEAVKRMRNTA